MPRYAIGATTGNLHPTHVIALLSASSGLMPWDGIRGPPAQGQWVAAGGRGGCGGEGFACPGTGVTGREPVQWTRCASRALAVGWRSEHCPQTYTTAGCAAGVFGPSGKSRFLSAFLSRPWHAEHKQPPTTASALGSVHQHAHLGTLENVAVNWQTTHLARVWSPTLHLASLMMGPPTQGQYCSVAGAAAMGTCCRVAQY